MLEAEAFVLEAFEVLVLLLGGEVPVQECFEEVALRGDGGFEFVCDGGEEVLALLEQGVLDAKALPDGAGREGGEAEAQDDQGDQPGRGARGVWGGLQGQGIATQWPCQGGHCGVFGWGRGALLERWHRVQPGAYGSILEGHTKAQGKAEPFALPGA